MSLIEIVCQAFTDEAAIFPMVHTNEKQSSCLPGKVTLFQQNIFVLILLFLWMFSGKKKKSSLIIFKSFLFISEIVSLSCRKHAQLLFNKEYQKVVISVFQFRCLKIACIGAVLVQPKINVLFFTHLLYSSYFDSQL